MLWERPTLIDCGRTEPVLGELAFEIDAAAGVGRGGTCLVYRAYQKEMTEYGTCLKRKVILKEFYPVAAGCLSWRREDGSLCIPDTDPDVRFKEEHFRRSRELFVRLHNEDSLNLNMAEAQSWLRANGTCYIVVDYSSGVSLEEYARDPGKSLWDRLSMLRNLALVISRLHGLGYLHLDLKPDNILCQDQHLVRLIDTDSLTEIRELKSDRVTLSVSGNFSAPEVRLCAENPGDTRCWNRFRKYCRRADVYAFGALLHQCLFDREPGENLRQKLEECYPDISGKARLLLQDLLESTLERSAILRCPDMDTVLARLDQLLPLVSPAVIRVLENFSPNPYPVVGREDRLAQVRAAVEGSSGRGSRIVCITGLGGVGKSTLARMYAQRWAEQYDVIVEVSADSAAEAIRQISIANWEPDRSLPEKEVTAQTVTRLAQLSGEHPLLLIVHNYDVSQDPDFELWGKLGCDILLTSRHDWSGSGYPAVSLSCSDLSEEEAAELFAHYYLADRTAEVQLRQQLESEKADLYRLLHRLDRHPLGIKLMARYMAAVPGKELLPGQALEELEGQGFSQDSPVAFQNDRDQKILEENVYGHLAYLFRSALDSGLLADKERQALRYFLLTGPDRGISAGRFQKWTGLHSFLPEKLRRHGWLEYYPNRQDLLDMEPHRGVYVLPMVLREVLRREPGMACICSDRTPLLETNNCIPFLAQAANADLSQLDSYERRYALCQEQQYLLKQLQGQKSTLLAWLLHRTAMNRINLNPRLLADPMILTNLNQCEAMIHDLGLKQDPLAIECRITQGAVYQYFGNREKALTCFYTARVLEGSRPEPHPWRMAETTLFLSRMHWEAGNLEKAIAGVREATSFLSPEEDKHVREKIYCRLALGEYLRVTGRWEEAERILLEAEKMFGRYCSDRDFSCIEIQLNLAAVYLDKEDPDRALAHLNRMLELSRRLYGDQTLSYNAEVLAMLADAWARKGDRRKAIAYREEFLGLHRQNDSPNRSWAAEYVYGILECQMPDLGRLHRLSKKPDPESGDRILAQQLLHLSLDYVGVDAHKTTQYLHAAVAAFNAVLGSYTVNPEDYQNLFRLYYQRAGMLFRQSRIPEGFLVLEDWFQLCRRLYAVGPENAMEAMCLSVIYSRFRCPERAERYRQIFRSHSPGNRMKWLGQWLFAERRFGSRYRDGKKLYESAFHDRRHFGAFCRLLYTVTQYKSYRRQVKAKKLRLKWRRRLQKKKYIRQHAASKND